LSRITSDERRLPLRGEPTEPMPACRVGVSSPTGRAGDGLANWSWRAGSSSTGTELMLGTAVRCAASLNVNTIDDPGSGI